MEEKTKGKMDKKKMYIIIAVVIVILIGIAIAMNMQGESLQGCMFGRLCGAWLQK